MESPKSCWVSNNQLEDRCTEDPTDGDKYSLIKFIENQRFQPLRLEGRQGSLQDSEEYFDSSSCKDWDETRDVGRQDSASDNNEPWIDALDVKDGWSDNDIFDEKDDKWSDSDIIKETDDKWNDETVTENEWNCVNIIEDEDSIIEEETGDKWKDDFEDPENKIHNSWNRDEFDEFEDPDNNKIHDSWNPYISSSEDKEEDGFTITNFAFGGLSKLPLRPEAEDCSFYMKTGGCKFGSGCKFNHPLRRKFQEGTAGVKGKRDGMEIPNQMKCKYFLKFGGCKYGDSCKFLHSSDKPSCSRVKAAFQQIELNIFGLPLRPGEKDCPHYMQNRSCKFGPNCRFNHPNSVASQLVNHKSSLSCSWLFQAASNASPYVPKMASQDYCNGSRWKGNQGSGYVQVCPPEVKICTFPERPGQPDCNHYVRTGDCKYGANCKFHHPKNPMTKASDCVLSDKGLPLRPDQKVCDHYSRYGICKFGPSCNFDHPISPPASTNGEQSFSYSENHPLNGLEVNGLEVNGP